MGPARKVVTSFVLAASVLQWSIIVERSLAALWAWYEFSAPFGGGGHITVGTNPQIAFYLSSAFLALLAAWVGADQGRWKTATNCSIILVVSGAMVWTAILLSPLASLRR